MGDPELVGAEDGLGAGFVEPPVANSRDYADVDPNEHKVDASEPSVHDLWQRSKHSSPLDGSSLLGQLFFNCQDYRLRREDCPTTGLALAKDAT